jgi:hypothetical protein
LALVLTSALALALTLSPAASKEDLSLALDVFNDRVDFSSAWDEVGQSWADVFTERLDEDLLQDLRK